MISRLLNSAYAFISKDNISISRVLLRKKLLPFKKNCNLQSHELCDFPTEEVLIMHEARTLQYNNVHNGVWHGHDDILIISSQVVFSPNGATDLALISAIKRPRGSILGFVVTNTRRNQNLLMLKGTDFR